MRVFMGTPGAERSCADGAAGRRFEESDQGPSAGPHQSACWLAPWDKGRWGGPRVPSRGQGLTNGGGDMKSAATWASATCAAIIALGSPLALAADEATPTDIGTFDKATAEKAFKSRPYSPYAGRTFPARPLFGDTHLHTSFSMDAGAFGARLGPKE